jgi:hypothetical protein
MKFCSFMSFYSLPILFEIHLQDFELFFNMLYLNYSILFSFFSQNNFCYKLLDYLLFKLKYYFTRITLNNAFYLYSFFLLMNLLTYLSITFLATSSLFKLSNNENLDLYIEIIYSLLCIVSIYYCLVIFLISFNS